MKRFAFAVCSVLLIAALVSCDNSASTPAGGSSGKKTVAVIPKGTTHEFWKSIHAGAKKAGEEFDLQVIWKGPLKEDDREDQIKVVEDFVNRGVDGIVLAPLDDTALVPVVENAVKQGMPVVIIDSDLKSDSYAMFVATDNVKAGQMAGEEMARLLDKKGQIVVLRYAENSASTTNRETGFLEAIKKYPDIKVVSDNQYAGATTESAYQRSENMLAPLKKPDGSLSIDGIFCPNESTTFGMLRALQDGKLAGKVKFVGFDTSEKLLDALKNDQIHALVVQDPFKMGYEGVKAMATYLRDPQSVQQKRMDTGAMLITKANLEDPAVKQLLSPPKE